MAASDSMRSWEPVPEKRQGLANVLLPRTTMASNSLTTSHVTLSEFDRCYFTRKKLNGIYVPVGWKNYSMDWKSMRSWEPVPEKRQGLANVLLPRTTMASNSLTTSHVTLFEFDRCHFTWKSTNGWDICLYLWQPSMVGCPVALIRDVNIWLDLKWKK